MTSQRPGRAGSGSCGGGAGTSGGIFFFRGLVGFFSLGVLGVFGTLGTFGVLGGVLGVFVFFTFLMTLSCCHPECGPFFGVSAAEAPPSVSANTSGSA